MAYWLIAALRGESNSSTALSWASTSPATCPITSAATWTYQIVLRRQDVDPRPDVGGPEEVPAEAERIRDVDREVLRLAHEEREVVRDDVGERDRDEAAEELVGQVSVVLDGPRGHPHCGDVRQRDEEIEEHEAGEGDEPSDHVSQGRRALDQPPS